MATEIQICNAAISLLGESASITSVDPADGSENAGLCQMWLPMAKRQLFEEADWGFAQRRMRLSELADIDAEIYGPDAHCYGVPADAVRIVGVYSLFDENAAAGFPEEVEQSEWPDAAMPAQWRIEHNPTNSARMIVCNVENAVCHYTAFIDETEIYPQYFVDPLILLLASLLTGPIKRTSTASSEAQNLLQQYAQAVVKAKTIDAQSFRLSPKRVPSKISSRWV